MNNDAEQFLVQELAHAILFDEGVEAARAACVAGASIAAAAITAAAWYDNPLTGLPALTACMECLARLPLTLEAWQQAFAPCSHPETGDPDVVPGFGFVTKDQAQMVLHACRRWVAARQQHAATTAFFLVHHRRITAVSGPLNQTGLAACCFVDEGIDLLTAERIFLRCRIDTAMREAQAARARGLAAFPFFSDTYVYEGQHPPLRHWNLESLRQEVGLA